VGTGQRRLSLLVIVAALVGFLVLAGCGAEGPYPQVTLQKKVEMPGVRQVSRQGPDSRYREPPLRVAIASILSPAKNFENYHHLLAYLERKLERPVEMVQRMTYAEVSDLMRNRQVDVAFVCTLSYLDGKREFGMELLVAPQIRGQTVYYSYLIVPSGSPVRSIDDLQGKVFAFSDPLSNSGHLAPTYRLSLMGTTPDAFFVRYVFTYSHDNSVVAVADRLVDGAAVDSLVYDYLATKEPGLIAKTRIIDRWGPYGIPPVVVRPGLDSSLKGRLQGLLLNMHREAEGRSILEDLFIDRFVLVRDEAYDAIRRMVAKVR